ncbi:MAG: hypothetical protein FJ118_04630 [Deltaproteobacteria bacterium]|nr:hypothetical protein [Deltaproteobacteria bacterium]
MTSNGSSFTPFLKVALLVYIVPFLILAFYAQPSHDDYGFTNTALQLGLWGGLKSDYFTITGRYFSVLLSLSIGLMGGLIAAYPLFVMFLIGTSFAALYFLSLSLLRGAVPNAEIFWVALSAFCIYLSVVPYPCQAFYWLTGGLHYQFAASLLVLLAASLMFKFRILSSGTRAARALLCCLLAAAVVGANETNLVIMLAMTAAGSAIMFAVNRSESRLWILTLGTGVAFGIIAVSAPGNYARALDLPTTHPHFHFISAILQSVKYGCYFSLRFLVSSPALWAVTLVLIPTALQAAKHVNFLKQINGKHLMLSGGLWLGLLIVSFFPRCFVLGHVGPPRAINTSYLVFFIGWLINSFLLIAWIHSRYGNRFLGSSRAQAFGRIALVVALLAAGNFPNCISDLLFAAPTYRAEMLERYAIVRESVRQGRLDVVVPPLSVAPTCLMAAGDLGVDTSYWYNTSMAEYFGARSLGVDATTRPVERLERKIRNNRR